jgi:hypothetical protein
MVVHGHNLHHFSPAPAMALSALRDSMGIRVHHTYHSVWESSLDIVELCREWPGQYALSSYVREKCESALGLSTVHTRPGVPRDRYHAVSPPRADRRTLVIGLWETVEPGVTGYVIPPGDLDALTDKVRTLLTRRDLAHQMGEAGRRYVSESFALEHYVGNMIELYRGT